jgi:hypothetical protein
MQWCQRLETDYGMDPRVWQSLDGQLSSGFVCFIYCSKLLNLIPPPHFIFILTGNRNEYKLYPELSSYHEKTGK